MDVQRTWAALAGRVLALVTVVALAPLSGCGSGGESGPTEASANYEEWTDPPAVPVRTGYYEGRTVEDGKLVRIWVTKRPVRPDDFALSRPDTEIVHANVYIEDPELTCKRTYDSGGSKEFTWAPNWDNYELEEWDLATGSPKPEEGTPVRLYFGEAWVREDMDSQFASEHLVEPYALGPLDSQADNFAYELEMHVGGSFLEGDKAQGWLSINGDFRDPLRGDSDTCEMSRQPWQAYFAG